MTGDAERAKQCYQNIITAGSAGDVYTVAGWAKGDSIPLRESESLGRRFGIVVRFYNTDGTEDETLLKFNTDADSSINWQYGAKRAVAKKNYSSIRVLLVYEKTRMWYTLTESSCSKRSSGTAMCMMQTAM